MLTLLLILRLWTQLPVPAPFPVPVPGPVPVPTPAPAPVPSPSPGPGEEESGLASIDGAVVEVPGERPLRDVRVYLRNRAGAVVDLMTTDVDGLFAFRVPPGTYALVADLFLHKQVHVHVLTAEQRIPLGSNRGVRTRQTDVSESRLDVPSAGRYRVQIEMYDEIGPRPIVP